MSDIFRIKGLGGKKKLKGRIVIGGAKNAALKLLAASVLFRDTVSLKNVPEIADVRKMLELLSHAGAEVGAKGPHRCTVLCGKNFTDTISPRIARKMRASVVATGPVLARFGRVRFPHPGGCVIGKRPIDLFLGGFEKMGARVRMTETHYDIAAPKTGLRGAEIFLKNQSVTATETLMMAGCLASGETVIRNASLEPEVAHVAEFLRRGGARIEGAGTTTVRVRGGKLLSAKGKSFTVMPDRIEAGSFLILGALAGGKLEIQKCNPDHLRSVLEVLREAGVAMDVAKDSVVVHGAKSGTPRAVDIKTHEYPGFPTDLQAPMTVFLTQAKGEAVVFETIFEGRLLYAEALKDMGADITVMDPHRILVRGPRTLKGKNLESPDLRAGLAYVIAAVVARGSSVIHNVYNIDRGYEDIENRLRGVGVEIIRESV